MGRGSLGMLEFLDKTMVDPIVSAEVLFGLEHPNSTHARRQTMDLHLGGRGALSCRNTCLQR